MFAEDRSLRNEFGLQAGVSDGLLAVNSVEDPCEKSERHIETHTKTGNLRPKPKRSVK